MTQRIFLVLLEKHERQAMYFFVHIEFLSSELENVTNRFCLVILLLIQGNLPINSIANWPCLHTQEAYFTPLSLMGANLAGLDLNKWLAYILARQLGTLLIYTCQTRAPFVLVKGDHIVPVGKFVIQGTWKMCFYWRTRSFRLAWSKYTLLFLKI